MDNDTREHIIYQLIEGIFPSEAATHSQRADGSGPLARMEEGAVPSLLRQEAETLVAELRKIDASELTQRIDDFVESQHHLNDPKFLANKNDYMYWVRLAEWSLDTAAALFLGRRPQEHDQETMIRYADQCKTALKYISIRHLMESWHWKNELPRNSGPLEFIKWARFVQIEIPEELVRAFDELTSNRTAKTNESESQPSAGLTKEKNTLLKLVLGMARAQYGYNPNSQRSNTVSQVSEDLDAAGLSLDLKTIRKYLREAAEHHWESEWE